MGDRELTLYGGPAQYLNSTRREVLIEGGARTGKSHSLMVKAMLTAEQYPGSRQLFTRETRVSLSNTILPDFERFVLGPGHPAITGTAKAENRTAYRWGNGSEILVIGMDDAGKILSGQFDRIYWFQAERGDVKNWKLLLTRLSETNTPYNQITGDANPAEEHNFINVRGSQWICGKCGTQRVEEDDQPADIPYCLECDRPYLKLMQRIRSGHTDNPKLFDRFMCRACGVSSEQSATHCAACHAPQTRLGQWTPFGKSYMDGLRQLDGVERQRYLLHQWCSAEGLIFTEYGRDKHHVALVTDHDDGHQRHEVSKDRWMLNFSDWFITWDLGYNVDAGVMVVWGVIGDRLYRVWEWYFCKKQTDEVLEAIYTIDEELETRGQSLDCLVVSHEKREVVDKINERMVDGRRYVEAPARITPWTGKDVGIDCVKRYLSPTDGSDPKVYLCHDAHRWGIDKALQAQGRPVSMEQEITAFTWIDPERKHLDQDKPDPHCRDDAMDNLQWGCLYHEHVGGSDWTPAPEMPALGMDLLGLNKEMANNWTSSN